MSLRLQVTRLHLKDVFSNKLEHIIKNYVCLNPYRIIRVRLREPQFYVDSQSSLDSDFNC